MCTEVTYLKDIKIHNKLPFLIGTFVVAGQLFNLISVRTESFIFDLVLKFSASLLTIFCHPSVPFPRGINRVQHRENSPKAK